LIASQIVDQAMKEDGLAQPASEGIPANGQRKSALIA